MLTYLADELRAIDHDRPPERAVRKTLFSLYLWRPARYRRPGCAPGPSAPVADAEVNKHERRSADLSMSIGWLNVQSLNNKTDAVSDVIVDRSLDVLALSETWHVTSNDLCLRRAAPHGYAVTDVPRSVGRGGGVAFIYRKHLKCSRITLPPVTTFETICIRLTTDNGPVVLLNVYRPGSARVSSLFFDELSSVLELLVLHSCPIVIGGDFNMHVHNAADTHALRLSELLSSFDIVQHVQGPTHSSGGTLDLVLTLSSCEADVSTVYPARCISDHALVVCILPIAVSAPSTAVQLMRGWRRADRVALRRALEDSPLCRPVPADADVDELFAVYDSTLREVADRIAPSHAVRRRVGHTAPWFDADCRALRRECRRLERRYRRTCTDTDRRQWVDAVRHRLRVYRDKKEEYWSGRIAEHSHSSPMLWRSLSYMLGRDRNVTGATGHSADGFAVFFSRKVEDVMAATAQSPKPTMTASAPSSMAVFRSCTQAEIRRIIMTSPSKSCWLDPVPTFLVREVIDVLLPFVTAMVNASLHQGRLPTSQKHAVVTPLLKKPGLDTADMANFRPVSNLTYMSKVVERAVSAQLNAYLAVNGLLPRCQSAYRKQHSTETAMLKVWSDALVAADQRQVTLLALLDLSAAFDCVDHSILLQRLELHCGLTGSVLEWLASFVQDRTQQVVYEGELSSTVSVPFGVPQGSVLGPLLFVLYTAELCEVVAAHGLMMHQYADDCQIYISTPVSDASSAVTRLQECLCQVNAWMSSSRLRLNHKKTEVMWLGSRQQLEKLSVQQVTVVSSPVTVSSSARDLGVIIDSQLSLSGHVSALCRSCYHQLRQLRPVTRSLSEVTVKTLVQAFVSCRLDYCNSLLYGMTDELFQRLQGIQNAAARLVTGTRRREHITPVLRQLHWLPVRQRVEFKLALLMHKSLLGQLPPYLADDCQLIADSDRRTLRSSHTATFAVRRTYTTFGDRSFAVAGAKIWNSLPSCVRSADFSTDCFKRALKTHLFG